MATVTTTGGAQFGNIPLDTLMVDKDAVVEIVSGSVSGVVDTVSGMIATAISTAWKPGGSVAASGSGALVYKSGTTWTAPLLVSGNEGKVYHLSEDYDITSDTAGFFKEGSGTHIEAGTDVAVIAHPTVQGGYIYDVLAVTDSSVVKSVNGYTPTNGAVTILNAVASGQTGAKDGLMSSGDKYKLNNIAAGAEVNQNAFSKIAVSGVTGTGDADSKTDTLTLVPGDNVTMSRSGKSVTINAQVPSGVVQSIVTDSGVVNADSCGHVDIHGSGGISVVKSGDSVFVDGSSIPFPVTDGKISGGSSLLSGTTIVIPVASTSAKGVTQLTDSVSNSTTTAITPNAVSGAISDVNSGLATKVSGGSLHTALSGSGLANGVGSTNNTIYALVNALHSVDGQNESQHNGG